MGGFFLFASAKRKKPIKWGLTPLCLRQPSRHVARHHSSVFNCPDVSEGLSGCGQCRPAPTFAKAQAGARRQLERNVGMALWPRVSTGLPVSARCKYSTFSDG